MCVPRGRACVRGCGLVPICRFARASAAGKTWTSRTTGAPWAARRYHTSVVDAAGAIYVIGGDISSISSVTGYQDVWASTDGGAGPDSVKGWSGGTPWEVLRGTQGVLRGYYRGYYTGLD
jgi:hypothetical protein